MSIQGCNRTNSGFESESVQPGLATFASQVRQVVVIAGQMVVHDREACHCDHCQIRSDGQPQMYRFSSSAQAVVVIILMNRPQNSLPLRAVSYCFSSVLSGAVHSSPKASATARYVNFPCLVFKPRIKAGS